MSRCKAKSKRSKEQCKNNSVIGKSVCRMHGAFSGPKTAPGILCIKKANTTHGNYSKEAIMERKAFRKFMNKQKEELKAL